MKTVLALALAVAGLLAAAGTSQATGVVSNAAFVNGAGQNVVFVRNTPFVNAVVFRRGLFGFRRVVVQQQVFGGVFVNQFVPGVGVVRIRVR